MQSERKRARSSQSNLDQTVDLSLGFALASSCSTLILRLQPLLLASPAPVSHEFPHVVVGLNCLSGLIAGSDTLMRIEFAHSLADMTADRIHQLAINPVFKHARNGMVAQIVGPQLVETGDVAEVIP